MTTLNNRILFVDDDPNILKGFQRNLRKDFTVSVAEGGQQALELIQSSEPFAVIVSDMQMPGMNGAEFLYAAKKISPDSVRMMLTGNADQQTAINAINKGDIFRFINKPCANDLMAKLLTIALAQYRLINAEKEILNHTLKGSIDALAEVLSLTKPDTFGRTARLKELSTKILQQLDISPDWELESLPQLCQIGYVVLPDGLIEKLSRGIPLNEEEQTLFEKHPEAACNLLSHIPRLENLTQAVRFQMKGFDGSGLPLGPEKGKEIIFGARLLKVIVDFNQLELSTSTSEASSTLQNKRHLYDPDILSALLNTIGEQQNQDVVDVSILQLRSGMVVAADILTTQGALLMRKGQEITPSVAQRLANFGTNNVIPKTISVYLPAPDEDEAVPS